MTNIWRTLLLVVVGLGAGWAASRIGSGPPSVISTIQESAATDDAQAAPPSAEAPAPTDAEIEAQIRRAEEALGDRADPNQELPVDPLRADVAIALPSDI